MDNSSKHVRHIRLRERRHGYMYLTPHRLVPDPAFLGELELRHRDSFVRLYFDLFESAAPFRYTVRTYLDEGRTCLRLQALIDYGSGCIEVTGPVDEKLTPREVLYLRIFHTLASLAIFDERQPWQRYCPEEKKAKVYIIREWTLESFASAIPLKQGLSSINGRFKMGLLVLLLKPLLG
ncbi:MAG: hypothetical protein KGI59_00095 [Patescibacteria group bacterium]|nr:hypothetical protein [Patescibacteria group bacterium]MDE2172540.1 hypothetical protein [Patescibacteria group bacterium]